MAVSKAVRDLVYGYAVATLDEAVNLRENGINKPILILGYVEPEEYEALVKNEIDATVFDYETAKALNDVALRLGKVAFCHIKVDTGMRRIGLEPDESGVEIVKKIKNLKALNARGLFTHLATADEKDKTAALRQIAKYDAFDDVGGKLSFALALLDKNNTGLILNAVHSRDNCFLYLKEIVKGESYVMLSQEEVEALRKAVNFELQMISLVLLLSQLYSVRLKTNKIYISESYRIGEY